MCYVQRKTFTYRYIEHVVARPFTSKFDILLRGCYLFRGMLFLRVTFIDVCKSLEFINNSPLREAEAIVLAKRRELLTGDQLEHTYLITERVTPNFIDHLRHAAWYIISVCLAVCLSVCL